ncbi:putative PPE family protein PPE22 [Mycobacterium shigaense]|uniref:Putative PPE family protein PPE22 n=1 Tax=Mycobacterium shigaense TaxID=722731 RepID=A0A1Z4EM96_9MYCO|nr:putative PPE family protein PPE22 [Mycobacterium shigaense]
MDFGALPPEINSGRMYSGPGPASLLTASAGWDGLAAELQTAAGGYYSVISGLVDESWMGLSSMSMLAAVVPFVMWMRGIAAQCEEAATNATAAAGAYETAFAMTVPPPMVAANRVRLMTLITTNIFGQNTPAIMATETEYSEMWALDAAAMYGYAANSASASVLSPFTSPPQTTDSTGAAQQARLMGQAAADQAGSGSQKAATQVVSSVPQTLQALSTPGSSAAVGTATGVGTSSATTPLSALSKLSSASSKGVTESTSVATGNATSLLTGTASGLGSGNIYDVLGLGSDIIGLESDMAGLGADGGGLGADGGGIGMDVYESSARPGGCGFDCRGRRKRRFSRHGRPRRYPRRGKPGPRRGSRRGPGSSRRPGHAVGAAELGGRARGGRADARPGRRLRAGGMGAMPSSASGNGISKLPLGGMVGRDSDGSVQRIGFRHSMLPRSPAAG